MQVKLFILQQNVYAQDEYPGHIRELLVYVKTGQGWSRLVKTG